MKKILFILSLLFSIQSFSQDSTYYSPDPQGDGTTAYKATVYRNGQVVNLYNVPEIPKDWHGLKLNLFSSPLYIRAITEANPNAYATLLKLITDGENGDANEQNLLIIINMLGMTFSTQEKAELNGYFQANNFTIRL